MMQAIIKWLWPERVPGRCQGCGDRCDPTADMCDDCLWQWAIK